MNIYPVGDMALSVDFGNVIAEKVNHQVMELERAIKETGIPGILEMVPSYRALMIRYNPRLLSYQQVSDQLENLQKTLQSDSSKKSERLIRLIPCCYGGAYGEDLKGMESITGLSQEEIIRIHAGTDYKIYMLGFLPGFVYLGGMDEKIAAPRLDTPRTTIPAGSVGIGGKQTGVYPIASPGGWRLIGTTPVKFYDPTAEEPILCKAGEYIRFVPVTTEEYVKIEKEYQSGTWKPDVINRSSLSE